MLRSRSQGSFPAATPTTGAAMMSDNASMPSRLEREHLLYDDEAGDAVGIDDVQLLDPIPSERIPRLRLLLQHDDLFVVYQATLVLTAWGDGVGLDKLEELVDQRVHRLMEFSPHRIYGYDNVYDVLAEAVSRFRLNSNERVTQRQRVLEKLLDLYGPCDFESKLKYALLDSDFSALAGPIDAAITRALAHGKGYLASQLLPPLARFAPARAMARLPEFAKLTSLDPNPELNIAEALRYVPSDVSRPQLERLQQHPNKLVASEAMKSLAALDKG
jgi:hypothetical protein